MGYLQNGKNITYTAKTHCFFILMTHNIVFIGLFLLFNRSQYSILVRSSIVYFGKILVHSTYYDKAGYIYIFNKQKTNLKNWHYPSKSNRFIHTHSNRASTNTIDLIRIGKQIVLHK